MYSLQPIKAIVKAKIHSFSCLLVNDSKTWFWQSRTVTAKPCSQVTVTFHQTSSQCDYVHKPAVRAEKALVKDVSDRSHPHHRNRIIELADHTDVSVNQN